MTKAKDSTGTALATKEQARLEELEAAIAAWINDAAKVGDALGEIRDSRLYRATHSTFEAYCQDAWGMGRHYANRLISARSVAALLEPMGSTPTERVARELAPLASSPEEMIGAWQRAVEEHGSPTAAQVRAIVTPPAAKVTVEVIEDAEIIDPPEPKAPAAPREPSKSPATLASFSRALNAALADGWSLEDISVVIERIVRERSS